MNYALVFSSVFQILSSRGLGQYEYIWHHDGQMDTAGQTAPRTEDVDDLTSAFSHHNIQDPAYGQGSTFYGDSYTYATNNPGATVDQGHQQYSMSPQRGYPMPQPTQSRDKGKSADSSTKHKKSSRDRDKDKESKSSSKKHRSDKGKSPATRDGYIEEADPFYAGPNATDTAAASTGYTAYPTPDPEPADDQPPAHATEVFSEDTLHSDSGYGSAGYHGQPQAAVENEDDDQRTRPPAPSFTYHTVNPGI